MKDDKPTLDEKLASNPRFHEVKSGQGFVLPARPPSPPPEPEPPPPDPEPEPEPPLADAALANYERLLRESS